MPLKEAMFVYVSRHSSAPIMACGILCGGEPVRGGGGEGVNLQRRAHDSLSVKMISWFNYSIN